MEKYRPTPSARKGTTPVAAKKKARLNSRLPQKVDVSINKGGRKRVEFRESIWSRKISDFDPPALSKQRKNEKVKTNLASRSDNPYADSDRIANLLHFGEAVWDRVGGGENHEFFTSFKKALDGGRITKTRVTELHGELAMACYFIKKEITPLYSWAAGTGIDGISLDNTGCKLSFNIYEAKGPSAQLTRSTGNKGPQMSDLWVARSLPTTIRAEKTERTDIIVSELIEENKYFEKLLNKYKVEFLKVKQPNIEELNSRVSWVRKNTIPYLICAEKIQENYAEALNKKKLFCIGKIIHLEYNKRSDDEEMLKSANNPFEGREPVEAKVEYIII